MMKGKLSPQPGAALLREFDRVYAVQSQQSADEITRHRAACVLFSRWLGRHAAIEDLTAAAIDDFERQTIADGRTKYLAERYRSRLKRVARMLGPRKTKPAAMHDCAAPGTLRHYFETVYAPHKLRRSKPKAIENYRTALRHFARFLERPPVLADLNDGPVTDFVYALELNSQTVNSYRSKLICLWSYAWRKGAVLQGPDVDALPEYRPEPVALTMEQLGRLFAAAAAFNRPRGGIAGIPSRAYWSSLVGALYDTGLRIGALRQARVADLNLDSDPATLFVPGEYQKSGKFARRPLHADTISALRETLIAEPDRTLIWPWTLSYTSFFNYADRLFDAAGIEFRRKRFHLLRRTAATQIAKLFSREKARQYLQHSTVATTIEHYLDEDQLDDDVARMCDLLPRPAKGGAA